MRTSALFAVTLLVFLAVSAPPVQAGGKDRSSALRRATQRIAELERELEATRKQAAADRTWTHKLSEFAADCLRRTMELELAAGPRKVERGEKLKALETKVAQLKDVLQREEKTRALDVRTLRTELARAYAAAEHSRVELVRQVRKCALASSRALELDQAVTELQRTLRNQQVRCAQDAKNLNAELAHANAKREEERRYAARSEKDAKAAAARAIEAHKEMQRLRWNFTKGAPAGSVARVLADLPASHWRREAQSKTAANASVALSVLAVLPDRNADTIEAILFAAHTHGHLLDRATPVLLRIGAPAVPALMAAGRSGGASKALNRGWVVHVLGKMGPAAVSALPWLKEVAQGEGREATQALNAIKKINAK